MAGSTINDLRKLGYAVKEHNNPGEVATVYTIDGHGLSLMIFSDQQDVIDGIANPNSHAQRLAVHAETKRREKNQRAREARAAKRTEGRTDG